MSSQQYYNQNTPQTNNQNYIGQQITNAPRASQSQNQVVNSKLSIIKKTAAVVGVIIVITWLISNIFGFSINNVRTLTVTATASETHPVGNIEILWQFQNNGKTRSEVTGASQSEFQNIVNKLSDIENVEVETTSPQITKTTTALGISEFVYRQAGRVSLSDPGDVPAIELILNNENVSVTQTIFSPPDNFITEQLSKDAIETAKSNAEKIANASGMRLGRIVNVIEVVSGEDQGNLLTAQGGNVSDVSKDNTQVEVTTTLRVTFATSYFPF